MENEPKTGPLPIVLAGVAAVACCLLGPVLIGAAGAGLVVWFGELGAGEIAALAGLAAFAVYGVIRFRGTRKKPAATQPLND